MRTLALLCGLALAATPSFADTIHTADGKTITDCTIVTEGIDKVTYKSGRNERQVDTQDVISIVYTDKPRALNEADGPLLDVAILGRTVQRLLWLQAYPRAFPYPRGIVPMRWYGPSIRVGPGPRRLARCRAAPSHG